MRAPGWVDWRVVVEVASATEGDSDTEVRQESVQHNIKRDLGRKRVIDFRISS